MHFVDRMVSQRNIAGPTLWRHIAWRVCNGTHTGIAPCRIDDTASVDIPIGSTTSVSRYTAYHRPPPTVRVCGSREQSTEQSTEQPTQSTEDKKRKSAVPADEVCVEAHLWDESSILERLRWEMVSSIRVVAATAAVASCERKSIVSGSDVRRVH